MSSNRTTQRALQILCLLAKRPDGMTLSEISLELEMPKPVHSISCKPYVKSIFYGKHTNASASGIWRTKWDVPINRIETFMV